MRHFTPSYAQYNCVYSGLPEKLNPFIKVRQLDERIYTASQYMRNINRKKNVKQAKQLKYVVCQRKDLKSMKKKQNMFLVFPFFCRFLFKKKCRTQENDNAIGICFDNVVLNQQAKGSNKKMYATTVAPFESRWINRMEIDWPNRMRRVKRQPIFIKLQFHQSHYAISLVRRLCLLPNVEIFFWIVISRDRTR